MLLLWGWVGERMVFTQGSLDCQIGFSWLCGHGRPRAWNLALVADEGETTLMLQLFFFPSFNAWGNLSPREVNWFVQSHTGGKMVETSVEPMSDSSSSIYLLLDPQTSWQHPARGFIAPITESSRARNASQCFIKSNARNSAGRQSSRCVMSECGCVHLCRCTFVPLFPSLNGINIWNILLSSFTQDWGDMGRFLESKFSVQITAATQIQPINIV